jgi:hypothetical protein
MISRHSVEQISQALFETDPMRTCCKENDCFDEKRLEPTLQLLGQEEQ